MRSCAVLAIGMSLIGGSALADNSYEQGMRPLFIELSRQCPQRNLSRLPTAELRYQLEQYAYRLSSVQRRGFADSEQRPCRDSIGGAACLNMRDVAAAAHFKLNRSMAAFVCRKAPDPSTVTPPIIDNLPIIQEPRSRGASNSSS
jgi:hypothetical protein